MYKMLLSLIVFFFVSIRRRQTSCALVTGVQTCALPISALEKITDAAGSHATNLNERVGQIDRALGEGVAQLAGALEPLTTLRDTVEELAGILANQNREAAE